MAMKKAMGMKLAVLALLLAVVSANALDFFELLTSNNQESLQLVRHKKPKQPCCDKCICTKSNPPQCSCWDVFIGLERCRTCENCLCTRSAIPQCRCVDVTDFCYPKCKPKAQAEDTATLAVEIASSD